MNGINIWLVCQSCECNFSINKCYKGKEFLFVYCRACQLKLTEQERKDYEMTRFTYLHKEACK
jgi:hypothetical protein